MSTTAMILVSGPGESLKSDHPEALHPILGDPALLWVLRALPPSIHSAIVVNAGGSEVAKAVEVWRKKGILPCGTSVVDPQQLELQDVGQLLVLSVQVPLLGKETLSRLLAKETPCALGGEVSSTSHACILSGAEQKTFLAAFKRTGDLMNSLEDTTAGLSARMEPIEDEELQPLRSRRDQAYLQALARDRVNGQWMDQGVTFLDPASTFVGPRVVLARDVVLEPGVRLEGEVRIGAGSRIGQGSILTDCTVGEGVEIKPYTLAQEAVIGDAAIIGPFARLREGTVLEGRVHIGNFVETKKTTLKTGAKANHLSYLGDTVVGEGTNIGAGLITCNYDGFSKHRTIIGRNVFVGSDCQLVAPVNIGDGALLGAGSTITENIPENALAFTRAPLIVKTDGATRLRDKLRAKLG